MRILSTSPNIFAGECDFAEISTGDRCRLCHRRHTAGDKSTLSSPQSSHGMPSHKNHARSRVHVHTQPLSKFEIRLTPEGVPTGPFFLVACGKISPATGDTGDTRKSSQKVMLAVDPRNKKLPGSEENISFGTGTILCAGESRVSALACVACVSPVAGAGLWHRRHRRHPEIVPESHACNRPP